MKEKILPLLLTAALVFSLAACGSEQDSGDTEQATRSDNQSSGQNSTLDTAYDQLRAAVDQVPEALEPDAVESDPDYAVIYAVYEPLFDLTGEEDDELSPCLASGYTKVSDRQWQISLQDDIYDWEGNNLTSDDVVFSFNWRLEQGSVSGYDQFDSIEVIDPYSFYINWTGDVSDLSEVSLPLTGTFIFSEKAYEEKGDFRTEPVGTGCYRITEYTPGQSLTLSADGAYWALPYLDAMTGRHKAKVQTLSLETMTNAEAVEGLENGTVDICGSLTVSEAAALREEGSCQVLTMEEDGFWYLGANTGTVSKNLREALFYALDDEEIAAAFGGSCGTLQAFGTPGQTDWDDSLLITQSYVAGQDLGKAQEYLENTDYSGSTLNLICPNSTASMQAAREILKQAEAVGITLEITSVTEDRFPLVINTDQTRRWDLALGYVEGPTLLDTWTQLLGNTKGGNILYLISDPTLLTYSESLTGEEKPGIEQFEEMQAYVVDNAFLYPAASAQKNIAYTDQIRGLTWQEGYFDLEVD